MVPGVKRIVAGTAAMLAVLLVSMWMSSQTLDKLEERNSVSERTYRSLVLVQDASRALNELEAGYRGYLLTGNRDQFDSANNFWKANYTRLRKAIANDSTQRGNAARIKSNLTTFFKLLNPVVAARRDAGTTTSPRLIEAIARNEPRRAQLINDTRNVLRQMRSREEKAYEQSLIVRKELRQQARTSALFNALLGTFFVVALAASLARQSQKIQRSNDDLRREIESRKRAEREQQMLASHNEQILSSTSEGIVGLNVKGRITYINPAAAKMLGWDESELLGKTWHDFAHHTRADNLPNDKAQSPILAALRDGVARRIADDVFWKREGRQFPVEYAVAPFYDTEREAEEAPASPAARLNSQSASSGPQLAGATLTFRDITERKRSEIALLRLASVVESSKDAILSHLSDGTIVSCNASAVKMYGYSARALEGQPLSLLFPPSRAEEVRLIIEHIAKGERIEPYQTTISTQNGERVDIALTFYPVRDARGNLMGASSNARPIRRNNGGPSLPTFDAVRSAPNGEGANGSHGHEAAEPLSVAAR
jgi:PAS domain S-box-containing protein